MLWNSTPDVIKSSNTAFTFTKNVKKTGPVKFPLVVFVYEIVAL